MEEKISAVKNKFENADENTVRELIAEYGQSDKAGIIKLVAKYQKQIDMLEAERERVENMLAFEKEYSMFSNICGIDEAGRGPLAGPVCAAAVILPRGLEIDGLNDSKKLSEKKYTIAFVDGCHENFDLLQQYRLVRWRGGVARLIAPNIFHLQRGEIYTIENQKYFAFGGGHSQDYEYRRDTGNWWRQEQPTHDEIRRAIRNLNRNQATVDYIITHEPPASLKDCLGVDVQQRLEIHAFFEDIIKECDYKKWFFGKCHMDRFIPMKFYAVFQDVLPVTDERD